MNDRQLLVARRIGALVDEVVADYKVEKDEIRQIFSGTRLVRISRIVTSLAYAEGLAEREKSVWTGKSTYLKKSQTDR